MDTMAPVSVNQYAPHAMPSFTPQGLQSSPTHLYRVVFLTVPTQKFLSIRKNQSIRTVPMGTVLKCLSMVKVQIL